jgi:hypothetical protein
MAGAWTFSPLGPIFSSHFWAVFGEESGLQEPKGVFDHYLTTI